MSILKKGEKVWQPFALGPRCVWGDQVRKKIYKIEPQRMRKSTQSKHHLGLFFLTKPLFFSLKAGTTEVLGSALTAGWSKKP